MKKIIVLVLVIFTLLMSTSVFYSCEIIDNAPDDTEDVDTNDNENNNFDDNTPAPDVPDSNHNCATEDHLDVDNNEYCDVCDEYLIVVIDLYAINDLHGKFCDTDSQIGVDELGTYLNDRKSIDDNVVIMSTGDMWQGTAESNLTRGFILTEWMNAMDFDSMTVGNHDFDWGTEALKSNVEIADFPFLGINVYSVETNERVDYCESSVLIERGGIKIGIIGAIGDCYSSISSDMVEDVYFKVGYDLTTLVMAESKKLREQGADFIIYQIHDGYSSDNPISNYYSSILSSGGFVDVVFESHTHQSYVKTDTHGVYHLQAGGENKGLSHVEFKINSANGNVKFTSAEIIRTSAYSNLEDDLATEAIEDKYSDIIDYAYSELGYVSKYMDDSEVESYVASLYLEAGLEKWGDSHNIVLGGGFLRTRSPYNLSAGSVCYADILSLLPFDNRIVLCSISGSKLLNKFINSTSYDYYISLSEYGNGINILESEVYYVVVDTYTALYAPNGLTIVDYYDDTTYARDLFAEKVKEGVFDTSSANKPQESYTLTSILDVLEIGNALGENQGTSETYYVKGTITSITNTTYGNMYIEDEEGNSIYLYGLYDSNGNQYNVMSNKPKVGDTIVVNAIIYKYVNNNSAMVELKYSTLTQ